MTAGAIINQYFFLEFQLETRQEVAPLSRNVSDIFLATILNKYINKQTLSLQHNDLC